MRNWGIAVLAVAAAACITACAGAGVNQSPSGGATPADRTVPDFVGKGLQTAQDDAQAAGFSSLSSHDASGRGRLQILDRDWKVCFQTPAAGSTVSSSPIDFGVVKLDETCPATDQGAQSPSPISEGHAMPDMTGKGLKVAVASLPSGTSIRAKDISGRHRLVIIESDWTVCSQDPAPGAQFNGQPVTFGVVKVGEPCP
jgi:hypothetical protein